MTTTKPSVVIRSEAWSLIRWLLLLFFLVAGFMVIWLPDRVERVLREGLEARLLVSAATFALTMPPSEWSRQEDLQGLVHDVVAGTGLRFTLIQGDGVVVADSTANPGAMENHINRPEILRAEAVGEGVAVRHSKTTGLTTLYTCRRVPQEGPVQGYVRMAVDLEEVHAVGRAVRLGLLVTLAPLWILGLVITLWRERRWRLGVQRLGEVAEAYQGGQLDQRVEMPSGHELQPLGDLLDTMATELAAKMAVTEKEHNRLNILIQNMAEPLIALEDPDTIMFTNQAFLRLTGSTLADPRGRRLWEVVRSEGLGNMLTQALQKKAGETLDFSPFSGRHFLVRTAPLPVAPGQPRAMVAVFQDVSELKTVEQMKSDFVANISHELRTPLQAIQGALETMEHDLQEGQVRFHAMASRNVTRMNDLVRDLLTLHKLEGGASSQPQWQTLNLAELLDDARTLQSELWTSKGQNLEVVFEPANLQARLDHSLMEHILLNLLANASKYSPDGASIKVTGFAQDQDLVLQVEDSGPGIDEIHRARIFERFFRVDGQRARQTGGTGLGLSIVKHAAQILGGEVVCLPGQELGGALFRLQIPDAVVSAEGAEQKPDQKGI